MPLKEGGEVVLMVIYIGDGEKNTCMSFKSFCAPKRGNEMERFVKNEVYIRVYCYAYRVKI
jgi:hypothetical protein